MNHSQEEIGRLCLEMLGVLTPLGSGILSRTRFLKPIVTLSVCRKQKKEGFDPLYLRKIYPPAFDTCDFLPSVGASVVSIAWKGSLFSGSKITCNEFAITTEFRSRHDNSKWVLTCVYGNVQMNPDTWLILGDFNLIRKAKDRNWDGGDISKMFRFNASLSQLGLNEIVLHGRKFTWSNMQPPPVLGKLDWVFTSNS